MIYVEEQVNHATLQLYDRLLREAPIDYLEATEKVWREDLYFIAQSRLPADVFDGRCTLKFHYTNQ